MFLLLPPLILAIVATLFLSLGRVVRNQRLWGPLAIGTLFLVILFEAGLTPSAVIPPQLTLLFQHSALFSLAEWGCLGFGLLLVFLTLDHLSSETELTQPLVSSAETFGLLLLSLSGLLLLCVVNDLLLLVLALELVALPVFVLLLKSAQDEISLELCGKFFLLHLLSTIFLVVGIGFLFGLTGTTCISSLEGSPAAANIRQLFSSLSGTSYIGVFSLVLIVAGLGMKLSVVPFQFGIADLRQGSRYQGSMLTTMLPRLAAGLALLKLFPATFPGYEQHFQQLFLVLAAGSMLAGGVMACAADQFHRQLAALFVAQGGFLLAILAVGGWEIIYPKQTLAASFSLPGFRSLFLWELGSQLASFAGISAIGIALARANRPLNFIDELAGLVRNHPLAAVCLALFLFNLAGIPPLPGFWSRLFLLLSLMSVQVESALSPNPEFHPIFSGVAICAIVSLLLTGIVVCRWLMVLFFEPPTSSRSQTSRQTSLATALFLAFVLVAFGALPGPIFKQCHQLTLRKTVSVSSTGERGIGPAANRISQEP